MFVYGDIHSIGPNQQLMVQFKRQSNGQGTGESGTTTLARIRKGKAERAQLGRPMSSVETKSKSREHATTSFGMQRLKELILGVLGCCAWQSRQCLHHRVVDRVDNGLRHSTVAAQHSLKRRSAR